MLSSNPVISPQDLELDRFDVTLGPSEIITATTTIALSDVNGGTYYVGVLADPAGAVDELSESNNSLAAFTPISVTGGALSITTVALPSAHVHHSYAARLSAVGGSGTYDWEVVQGVLPDGIGLVAASGELFGRPSSAEMQAITVRVTSGNETDEATFLLVVSDPSEPLTLVTRSIPAAIVGQEYSFRLIATGGSATSSLAWSAEGLPDGLSLSSDGVLIGSVSAVATTTVTVTVSDGTESATRPLLFEARENLNLLIVPNVLSTARYGEPYSAMLESTGGLLPITWLLDVGNLPDGIELDADGTLIGTPLEVGRFRFVVEARDSGPGSMAATDVNSFELEVIDASGTFVITTTELPRGMVGAGYDARVEAEGGLPPYEWKIEDGRLPEGFIPTDDGETNAFRLNGAPTTTSETNLLISVVDSQGRIARRAFALIIEEAEMISVDPAEENGCGCTAASEGSASLAGLLLLLGLASFRRRSP
jgi:MYXO-CTERM domain-containing protein